MLMRLQPWTEMETLRRQMGQLFDEFAPITREPLLSTVNRAVRTPAIELHVTPTHVVLRAELPGLTGKDLDIKVTREAVSITVEYRREAGQPEPLYSELRQGKFHRVIALPVEVQNDATQAEFKDGILTLTMAKVGADRAEVFQVNLEHEPTPEIVPDVTPEVAPQVTPEVPPAVTPGVTPGVTPEVTPVVPPQVTPEVIPEVNPQVTPVIPPTMTPPTASQS
jgi:HSP20 family protein